MEKEEKKPEKIDVPDTKEKRMAEIKEFSKQVLDKYGEYVKCIVTMGSVARDEFKPKSDIDIFVVMDDTNHTLTAEQLDKIDADLEDMARKISENISIQPTYTLTEFWDFARVCHPIIYNFIKEGLAVYDTGFFMPIKKLLEMGKIPSTREAIESYMEGAPKKLVRAKTVKLLMLAEDCYYAVLNSVQAVLMFMGLPPPVPNKAYEEVKKNLVEPGILEPEYAETLKEIIDIRKKIEHKEITDVKGEFVDEWIEKSEKFIDKMFALLNALEIRKKEKILERTHEVMLKAAITALKSLKKVPGKDDQLSLTFKKEFVDTKLVEPYYWNVWQKIEGMKKMIDDKKIDQVKDKDVYDMREYIRKLIRDLAKVLKDKEIKEE
jgi:predicted nucleotidyltransferase/uncharacterized protein (UPF0332 family)